MFLTGDMQYRLAIEMLAITLYESRARSWATQNLDDPAKRSDWSPCWTSLSLEEQDSERREAVLHFNFIMDRGQRGCGELKVDPS